MRRWTCLLAIAIGLAAPPALAQEPPEPAATQPPSPPPTPDAVRAAVDAGNYFFSKHFEARDAQAIADLYTEDARVIAPGAPVVEGRPAIAAFWAEAMKTTKSVRLETLAVESDGNLAVEEGRVDLTANDGTQETHRYVVVWKRVGRRWHLHRDVWNAAEPATASPATPAPTPSATPLPELDLHLEPEAAAEERDDEPPSDPAQDAESFDAPLLPEEEVP